MQCERSVSASALLECHGVRVSMYGASAGVNERCECACAVRA